MFGLNSELVTKAWASAESCSCLHIGNAIMGTHRRPPEKTNCHSVHQTCTTSSFLLRKSSQRDSGGASGESMATEHEVVAFLTGLPKHCTPPHILHCQDQPAGQGPGRQVSCPHRREKECLRCPFPNLTTSTKVSLIYSLWPLFPDTVRLKGLEKRPVVPGHWGGVSLQERQ